MRLPIFRFGPTQKTAVQLLGLVPSIIVTRENANIEEMSEMYKSDLPSPQTLDVEFERWLRKWQSKLTKPDSLQPALEVKHFPFEISKITKFVQLMKITYYFSFRQACDPDIFPNINCLLRIACTIPVTSADNERANSTLKLVKGYLRTTMTTERLSGLALMNIHYEKPVNYDAVVQLFAEKNPRRMLLVDPVFDETQN